MDTTVFIQKEKPDYFTKHGALILGHRIKKYYEDLGIKGVEIEIVPRTLPNHDGSATLSVQYDVRSNLRFVVPK